MNVNMARTNPLQVPASLRVPLEPWIHPHIFFQWRNTAVKACDQWAAAQFHNRNTHMSGTSKRFLSHLYCYRAPRAQGSVKCLWWQVNSGMEFPSVCVSLEGTYFLGYDKLHSEDVWIVTIELKMCAAPRGRERTNLETKHPLRPGLTRGALRLHCASSSDPFLVPQIHQ